MPPADLAKFRRAGRRFRLYFAILPVHVPKVYSLTDGDDGRGHIVSSNWCIPRMGPDRIGLPGVSQLWYAGNSFIRGGGGASGFQWKAFYYPPAQFPVDDAIGSSGGTDVTGSTIIAVPPEGVGNPATMKFTPTQIGTYRIELRTNEMPADDGDYHYQPVRRGMRWVKTFQYDAAKDHILGRDLAGVTEIQGPTGGVQQGGHSMTITYRRPDNVGTRQTISPMQRIVVMQRHWWLNPTTNTWDEYTWTPDHGLITDPAGANFYAPQTLFEGLVRGSSIFENVADRSVTFTIDTPQVALGLLNHPTITKEIEGLPADFPTVYIDQAFYEDLLAEEKDLSTFAWIHQIPAMEYSDPLIHQLDRHSTFPRWFDYNQWQQAGDQVQFMEAGEGDMFSWIRAQEQARFGIVVGGYKGELNVGPNPNLRGPDHWATRTQPDVTLDPSIWRQVNFQAVPEDVGQVVLTTLDAKKLLPALLQPTPAEDELQMVKRYQYVGMWPSTRGPGRVSRHSAVPIFSRSETVTMARRVWRMENAKYPSGTVLVQLATAGMDLLQTMGIQLPTKTQETDFLWTPNAKVFLVVGINHAIKADHSGWDITYTLSELTDAASVMVPDKPPVANFTPLAIREVMSDGTEKRIVIVTDQTREGDNAITTRTWTTVPVSSTKTTKRALFVFEQSVNSVSVKLDVTDSTGLTSTLTRTVDIANLPVQDYTLGEAIWAVSDKGHHVSPDGGKTWVEDKTLYVTPPVPPTIGQGTAVWATDNSAYGFFGNAAGEVFITKDMGKTVLKAAFVANSRVNAMFGTGHPPTVFYGCANGKLYEAAYDRVRNTLQAAELPHFTTQVGSQGALTFVFYDGHLIYAAAGRKLFVGTRTFWQELASFPGNILRGSARAEGAAGAEIGDTSYTFVISLVFQNGSENVWEQGRVKVGEKGIVWITETLSPAVGDSGTDTAVGALNESPTGILAAFEGHSRNYLLPNPVDANPGPAIQAAPGAPVLAQPITAIEYSLEARDFAFAGDGTGIRKNLDPNGTVVTTNEAGVQVRAPSATNLWLPFHETAARVRDLWVTRPNPVTLPVPVIYSGVGYVFIPEAGNVSQYVWSPKSVPPQYVLVERWHSDEAGGTAVTWQNALPPAKGAAFGRVGSATTGRGLAKETLALPPGFSSISLFVAQRDDTNDLVNGMFHITSRKPNNVASAKSNVSHAAGHGYLIAPWIIVNGLVRGHAAHGKRWNASVSNDNFPQGWLAHPYYGSELAAIDIRKIVGGVDGPTWFYANVAGPARLHDPLSVTGVFRSVWQWYDGAHKFRYVPWQVTPPGEILGLEPNLEPNNVIWMGWTGTLLDNEYVNDEGVLYRWPLVGGNEFSDYFASRVAVTGVPNPINLQAPAAGGTYETWDTYWFCHNPNTTTWALYFRVTSNSFSQWIPPQSFKDYYNTEFGTADNLGWVAMGQISAMYDTKECLVLLKAATYARHRLALVRSDGTWEDRSGNIWNPVTIGTNTAPALFQEPANKTLPNQAIWAVRHVLQTEFPLTEMV